MADGSNLGRQQLYTPSDDDDETSLWGSDLPEFDQNDIINYLYPPAAIRTEVQKRTQITFLQVTWSDNRTYRSGNPLLTLMQRCTRGRKQHLICRMKHQYNDHVESLKNDKEEAVHGINVRNVRVTQILEELGSEVSCDGIGCVSGWIVTRTTDWTDTSAKS